MYLLIDLSIKKYIYTILISRNEAKISFFYNRMMDSHKLMIMGRLMEVCSHHTVLVDG